MIEARDIYKQFGKVKALNGVTATIKKGEVVVIIGPSGSGKSTFLRCLNHLEKIDRGTITIDGIPLTSSKTNIHKIREEIGMVFQHFNLFPHLTVLRNITLAQLKVRKRTPAEAEKIARDLLAKVGIPDKADNHPFQLSGGQQQRVAIARAMAMQPKIMLFDEPTSALDPIATASIEELISSLKETVSILIVTHNMQQAARCSDYTAFMYLGELVEFGETDQVFIRPGKKETEDYITGRFG